MTDFQQDLVKIFLDKALLGVIAMLFGFWLARRLEDYRLHRSYDLFVLQQRVKACQQAAEIVSKHFQYLMGLYDTLELVAAKYPQRVTDEESKPGWDYIKYYEQMKQDATAISPLLPRNVMAAFLAYLGEAIEHSIVNGYML